MTRLKAAREGLRPAEVSAMMWIVWGTSTLGATKVTDYLAVGSLELKDG